MSLSALTTLAAETAESEPLMPAWVVGAGTLAVLLLLLVALLVFAGGREHS